MVGSVIKEAPTKDEIISFSQGYFKFWTNRAQWLVRKVIQYEDLDRETERSKTSYDIDFATVDSYHLDDHNGQRVLPIESLWRIPFISLSLEDPWNNAACVATRSECARATCYIVYGWLQASGVDLNSIEQDEIPGIFRILRDPKEGEENSPAKEMKAQLEDINSNKPELNEPLTEESNRWENWIRNSEFRKLMEYYNSNFLFGISYPLDRPIPRGIVKLRWTAQAHEALERLDQSEDWSFASIRQRIVTVLTRQQILPPRIAIPGVYAGDELTLHQRIIIPPGMRVEDVRLSSGVSDDKQVQECWTRTSKRWNGRAIAIYGPRNWPANVSFEIFMNPKRGLFVFPALFASIVLLFLVVLVVQTAYFIETGERGVDSLSYSTSVIGALFPALLATHYAVSNEHERVTMSLGFRRLLLVVGVLLTLFYALFTTVIEDPLRTQSWFRTATLFVGGFNAAMVMFFLFEIFRIETWRHQWTRKRRRIIVWFLAAISLICVGLIFYGFCYYTNFSNISIK